MSVSLDTTVYTYPDKKTVWDMIPSVETTKNIKGNLEMKRGEAKKFDQMNLPTISIVTITKNRKKFFDIAINNWVNFAYDRSKLEWIILDDSPSQEQQLHDKLEPLLQQRQNIKYVLLSKELTVGRKRNIGCEIAAGEYIIMMDDDDVYFSDSILSKVITLVTHDKDVCFSRPLAILDVKNMSSYILENFEDVAEASLAFTKKYWLERRFDDTAKNGEGRMFIAGNENKAIELPFYFNFICIQHTSNLTGRLRQIRYLVGMRNAMRIQKMQTLKTSRNFFKDFNQQTRTILKKAFDL